jgi:hypothetical protein
LHESVKATLRRIQIARHFGRGDLGLEQSGIVRQRHVMNVTVRLHALILFFRVHARIVERTRCRVHERKRFFFNKRAEAESEILGYVSHAIGQQLAQLAQLVLVGNHGVGQVHEKIQVDWIVLGQLI